ncbi:MAG: VOC family protein [Gemmatimonadetes bacterium]|nr:VOC family protein [Gemmatimonadota bacterium]
MAFKINHIHLKTKDPKKTADWWVKAFNFKIVSDVTRPTGDRFISCRSEDGLGVNISGARTGDRMGPADGGLHFGLEHFGLDSADIEADIRRLKGSGCELQEGPIEGAGGVRIAFLKAPDDVRIELVQRPGA